MGISKNIQETINLEKLRFAIKLDNRLTKSMEKSLYVKRFLSRKIAC